MQTHIGILSIHNPASDSFKFNSGTRYYNEAQKILNLAQQNNSKGWNQVDGSRNRFWIIDSLMSKTYEVFRSIIYNYHRNGLDFMIDNPQLAKNNIKRYPKLLFFEVFHVDGILLL